MSRKVVLAFGAAMVAAALAWGCGGAAGDADVAARYDGGTVSEAEVTQYTAEYRAARSYDTDEVWAQHLFESGLTTKTWREQVIGSLVEERLQLARAAELGIEADEQQVEEQMAQDKESAGIAVGDDAAWDEYLAGIGMSADGYRENLEHASIEAQLLSREVELDVTQDDELIDAYIESNLLARIVKRYRALCFNSAEAAQAAINDMAGLAGDELAERFDSWLEHDDSDETSREDGGDIGWDIASDLGSVQQELNSEKVEPNELSAQVHELDGKYYVLLCTSSFTFERGLGYDDMPDDDLRDFLLAATTYENWSRLTSDYIASLREAAHVQVREMPQGLPYDADELISAKG